MDFEVRPRQRGQHLRHLRREGRLQRPLGDQDPARVRLGRESGQQRGDAGGRVEVPQAVEQHGAVVDRGRGGQVRERLHADEGDVAAQRPRGDVGLGLTDGPEGAGEGC